MSDEAFECRIWGKSKRLPPGSHYPLVCHLVDTAVMADVLWDAYLSRSQRRVIAEALGVGEDAARRVVAFWAGLHDVGKAVPGWQAGRGDLAVAVTAAGFPEVPMADAAALGRHEASSQLLVPSLLGGLGWGLEGQRDRVPAVVAGMVAGGHHGRYGEPTRAGVVADPVAAFPGLGGGRWAEQREAMARVLAAVTGATAITVVGERIPAGVITVVTGLVVLADWLVSQEDHLLARVDKAGRVVDTAAVHAWAAESRTHAQDLVADAGLTVPELPEEAPSFTDMFSYVPITTPNQVQSSIAEHLPGMLGGGSGLLLVTAPTGDGKTEAALFGASLLGRACGTHGVYVALPTMATTNQMHGRLKEWARQNLPGAVTRLHGMEWMHDPEPRVVHGDDGVSVEATRWLRQSNRHGLLAHLNAGTIDQALLSVLPLGFGQLRHLGLSGKTLIVDEAHSYDAFTHALLLRLLEWCGAWQVPVVVLSATLTGESAAGLVNAYRSGAGHTRPERIEPAYPGWSFTDQATGATHVPSAPVGTDRGRDLRVEMVTTRGTQDRQRVILAELQPLVRDGGCAAVICTTVAHAQATFRHLVAELRGTVDLHLLHARLPAHQRDSYTTRAESAFGRVNKATTVRPERGIIVATQVIEQSLDLDFDLIISDLAPLALLLQRAGRAFRHGPDTWAAAGLTRPAWAGTDPRMVVLTPADTNGAPNFAPPTWGSVYPPSLLQRTWELLDRHPHTINIPGDVQTLVNAVYDPAFTSSNPDTLLATDRDRTTDDTLRRALADLAMIPSPRRVHTGNLHRLTASDADPDLITTRLGANSVNLIPTFHDTGNEIWLDPEHTMPLPQPGARGRLTRAQIRTLMSYAVPMRAGGWLTQLTPDQQPHPTWATEPRLTNLVRLPHYQTSASHEPAPIGSRQLRLHPALGIVDDTHTTR
ncbi:CRISPR-associated helicase/endonuclease Cas3 [Streptomyces sp. 769]|uniref:CRISPR-associated helicase/endonuclease Cas3 n=1 Tax=Streptomyces sp. 769 TaxID=1262452 RepID=UPI00058219E9|nr:CRISPR-associated helicase/endonuclease Cas3 [Streptomyces sp. 769]AJC62049.1 CRISPR-associated helicase Cas3 [Streptomyces sp. 769]